MNPMVTVWLVLLILFLIAEGATAAVTTMWFAAGSLVAMIAALLGAEVWLQVTLFILVSVACLLALRPLLKKYINPKKTRTNIDSIIGSQGVVIQGIDNLAGTGRVKIGGMEWAARSENGEVIDAGAVVKVEKIEGVKVLVTLTEVKVS